MMGARDLRGLVLAIALGALGACSIGGSSPQPVYWSLEGQGGTDGPGAREQRRYTAVVTTFEVGAPYDRRELVLRSRTRELRYAAYDLWASRPGRMLADATRERLRASGIFQDVSRGVVAGLSDYELRGEVLALEQRDLDGGRSEAHLAMRFELVSVERGEVVLRYGCDRSEPLAERRIGAVAAALDRILGEELSVLAERIAAVLPP